MKWEGNLITKVKRKKYQRYMYAKKFALENRVSKLYESYSNI